MFQIKRLIHKWFLVLLLIILGSLNVMTFRDGHPKQGDFAQYLIQAKGIVDGNIDKYVEMAFFRKEHNIGRGEPALYPWGFPILLSPIYAVWGRNLFILKVYMQLFFLFACSLIYLLFKDKIEKVFVFSIIAFLSLNPYFFWFKNNILSDIPHMMFTMASIYLIDGFVIQRRYFYNVFLSYMVLGFVLFWAYFTRLQGMILILLLLSAQFIQFISVGSDRRKILPGLLLETIPLITFIILCAFNTYILFPSGQSSYADHFSIQRILMNIVPNIEYYLTLPIKIIHASYPPLTLFLILSIEIIYLLFLLIIVFGICRRGREDYLFTLLIVYYTGFFIIYPYQQGLRFLIPIMPFVFYFFFYGLIGISSISVFRRFSTARNPLRLVKNLNAVLLIISFVAFMFMSAYRFMNRESDIDGPYGEWNLEVYKYIRENTDDKDVVVHPEPRTLTLETDRYAVFIDTLSMGNYNIGDFFVVNHQFLPDLDPDLIILLDSLFSNDGYTIFRKLNPQNSANDLNE